MKKPLLWPLMYLLSRKTTKLAQQKRGSYHFFFMRASGEQLATLAKLYEQKKLVPTLDKTFPFDRALEALAYAQSGRANGKVVLTFRGQAPC